MGIGTENFEKHENDTPPPDGGLSHTNSHTFLWSEMDGTLSETDIDHLHLDKTLTITKGNIETDCPKSCTFEPVYKMVYPRYGIEEPHGTEKGHPIAYVTKGGDLAESISLTCAIEHKLWEKNARVPKHGFAMSRVLSGKTIDRALEHTLNESPTDDVIAEHLLSPSNGKLVEVRAEVAD